MASKRLQRPNLTSEFKSMAQVTYYSMLILPVLAFLWPDFQLRRRRRRLRPRRKLQDVDLLPQVKMPMRNGCSFMSRTRSGMKRSHVTPPKNNYRGTTSQQIFRLPLLPKIYGRTRNKSFLCLPSLLSILFYDTRSLGYSSHLKGED